MSDDNQPCCAHIRVSYRTEDVEHDFGPLRLPLDRNDPNVPPHGVMRVTRGWWECDSGCGKRFEPTPPASSSVPSGATTTMQPDRISSALGFLRSCVLSGEDWTPTAQRMYDAAFADVSALWERAAGLEADAKRLDWLQQENASVICGWDFTKERHTWRADNPLPGGYRNTLREAIDAARSSSASQGEPT